MDERSKVTDKVSWEGAEWISSPGDTINADALVKYSIEADVSIVSGSVIGIAIAARNKDNYVLAEIDMAGRLVRFFEYSDNAWTDGVPAVTVLGKMRGYGIGADAGAERDMHHIVLSVDRARVTLKLNGICVADDDVIPQDQVFMPRKQCMLNFGFKQVEGCAVYDSITVRAGERNILLSDDFADDSGVLSCLGKVTDNALAVENEFRLVNAVPSVNVRRFFRIDRAVRDARLYASAMGFYEAYINGSKVNDTFYDPGFTDYRKRMYYQEFDVTGLLKNGANVIGATVAKGYYTGYIGYNAQPMVYGRKNAFISKLVIVYEDGMEETIVSDEKWQFTCKGPVMNADYLQGEDYDARLCIDWADADDRRWGQCGIVPWPCEPVPTNGVLERESFVFEAQRGPGAGIERVLTPVSIHEQPKGHFIYDLGQNMVGTVRIRLNGMRGESIKLRYGEMCRKSGELYTANLRNAANTDTYTLRGRGTEEFIPSFTSHGFRYIEITGNGYALTREKHDLMIKSIEGLVITNVREMTGSFECSDPLLNKLQKNIEWGQRGNSLLVFTDCPQRNERMGWTGDVQVFAKTAAYNMNVKAFMNKWLTDMRDAQLMYNLNGAVPDTAPLGGDNRKTGGCAGWGDAAVIVPWEMYIAYGDETVLRDNYEMMKAWVDYQSREDRQNHGMRTVDGEEVPECSDLASIPYIQIQQSRGDHLAFDESTPFILSATAYAARAAELMYKTAEILDRYEDAEKYRARCEKVRRAFREAWVQEDGSLAYWGEMSKSCGDVNGNVINRTRYCNSPGSAARPSQTAYALAIDFGLIPEDKLMRAAECFQQSIDDRNGLLSVGFLGISHLAPALTKARLTETAYALLEQKEDPSWLYSVRNGATTIWERWDSYIAETDAFGAVSMNSFNHYAYGAIGEWMFGTILGINSSEKKGETGYRKIILKPTPGGSLSFAKGSYICPYGIIKSEWRIENGIFSYNCTIPENTTAVLYLPLIGNAEYSGQTEPVRMEKYRAVYELDSGSYSFKAIL